VRIGVNTGELVVGEPGSSQTLVTGDPVNVAARLEQAAASMLETTGTMRPSSSTASGGAVRLAVFGSIAAMLIVQGMLREARHFAKLAPNIVVKVPMSEEGLEAMACLAEEEIKTNGTLIFSANQGLTATLPPRAPTRLPTTRPTV
jgi:hypothetical protein